MFLIAIQASPAQQQSDRRTWYQAYADAQKAIQDKNWQKAINDLAVATQKGAPKPARNVLFYGDVYRDYDPDYYLGIAYTNLQRFTDADSAFERVRQAQLINPRDSVYAEFTRQAANVKDVLAKEAAQARSTAPNTTAPNAAPNTTAANRAAQNPADRPADQNVAQRAANPPNASAGIPSTNTTNNTGVAQNATANSLPSGVAAAGPARQGPNPSAIPARRNPQTRPTPQATANAAAIVPTRSAAPPAAGPLDERTGLVQFFSGDYESAAASLATVAAGTNASPRAHFYLACAQAALVLTGKAPRTSLEAARGELALVKDTGQFAADKRLISPRIMQELGMQP
jgi:hypothetical protein